MTWNWKRSPPRPGRDRLSLAMTVACFFYVIGMLAINLYSETNRVSKGTFVDAPESHAPSSGNETSTPFSSKVSAENDGLCPQPGEKLVGPLAVALPKIVHEASNVERFSVQNGGNVQFGGWWRPKHCKPRYKVAFLIPYRNRELQLKMFISHVTPILQRQLLEYRFFVIEQSGNTTFNKGAIYNIGFNSTLQFGEFDCYIFHDVDLLLENDKNYHGCVASPMHMAPAVDTLNYRLFAPGHFGGIELFTREHFEKINGFTNMFWGWGAEDDDLYLRVVAKGLKLHRPPINVARYTMNKQSHFRSDPYNDVNARMVRMVKNRLSIIDNDGLRQISTLKFSKTVSELPLITKISIDLRRN